MSRETLLVRTLVELADSLVDDFDIVEVLTMLSDRCVEAFDVAAAGVMLADPSGELRVAASSSDAMRILELFELQADEGPCVDSYRTGKPIVNLDLTTIENRWPRFTPRAIADGYRSVHSLPLRLRGRTIGALNMFRSDAGALQDGDVVAAQALADVATIAILQNQAAFDSQTLNNQLIHALNSRVVIEQAKGKVSEAARLDMDQSFARIRAHARNHNVRLSELCSQIATGSFAIDSLDALPAKRRT